MPVLDQRSTSPPARCINSSPPRPLHVLSSRVHITTPTAFTPQHSSAPLQSHDVRHKPALCVRQSQWQSQWLRLSAHARDQVRYSLLHHCAQIARAARNTSSLAKHLTPSSLLRAVTVLGLALSPPLSHTRRRRLQPLQHPHRCAPHLHMHTVPVFPFY
jgi:hypothetical protein